MPSSATLATLRDRLELVLQDSSNTTWATADLDEAITQALERYSAICPCYAITTLTLAAAGREISLASVSGLLRVIRVWWEYTAADPEYPPHWRNFELWPGPILFINDGAEPQSGDVVRIWYTAPHTLKDLSSATSTSFPAGDEGIIITGAAAIAALARALETSETLNVDGATAERLMAWGQLQEQRFTALLAQEARRQAARESGIAPVGRLDRWDEAWEADA